LANTTSFSSVRGGVSRLVLHHHGLGNGHRLLGHTLVISSRSGGRRLDLIRHLFALDRLAEHRIAPTLGRLAGDVFLEKLF
jgi:hypothetical protein